MIRFFRINDPYRLLFLFLLLAIVRVLQSYFIPEIWYLNLKWLLLGEWLGKGYEMYSETFDYTAPFSALLYKSIDWVFGRAQWAHTIFGSVIIVIQAGIFNQILLRNKAYNENGYLSAFIYVVFMMAIPDEMALSPELISLTFILLGLNGIIKRLGNQITDIVFLEAGIFVGLAFACYTPSIVFLFFFLLMLLFFARVAARRVIVYFFGFILVYSFTYGIYYYRGISDLFFEYAVIQGFQLGGNKMMSIAQLGVTAIVLGAVFLIAVARSFLINSYTSFQLKLQQVILIFLIAGIVILFTSKDRTNSLLVFFAPVYSFFVTNFLLFLNHKILKRVLPAAFIMLPIIYQTPLLNQKETPQSIEADNTQKVMVLGGDLLFYKESSINSPSFNKDISGLAFQRLDYYQSSVKIFDLIEQINPEIIVDEMQVVEKLFYRFPTVAKKYEQISPNSYKRID